MAGTLFSLAEPYLPYQHPPLSKAFLAGETHAERLELKPRGFYDEMGVDLRLGTRIAAIDVAGQQVEAASGVRLHFARLLIATGTRPRALPLPGDQLEGVHHIRAIRDVERFRDEIRPGAHLVVIGGGYIGLEVAAKARAKGLDVTVLETQSRILARVVAPETASCLARLHEAHGVMIRTQACVLALEGQARVRSVLLGDGSRLAADIVLIAVGASPNHELAAQAGINIDDGVLVDGETRTNAPNIFAAGDVANFPSHLFGRRVRLESVPNAIDMAKTAASAMLGMPVRYDPVPWFWSDQYDSKLQIVGLSQGHDRTEITENQSENRLNVRYFAQNRLLAVDTINDARTHMMARRSLASPTPAEAVA